MRLCALTSNWPGNPTIYVNPANVVAIQPSGEGAMVITNAPTDKGQYTVYVPVSHEQVAILIEAAMRD